MNDMPSIQKFDVLDKSHDRQMVNISLYRAPLDGAADPHREFDRWVAQRAMAVLSKDFPGYPWDVECNAQQGIVHFGIRALMGPTLRWVIRLAQWSDLTPSLVREGGGQLLERFNLPRRAFDAASFVEARDHKERAQIDFKRRF